MSGVGCVVENIVVITFPHLIHLDALVCKMEKLQVQNDADVGFGLFDVQL